MSDKKQSGHGSSILNQLEDFARIALTAPEPVGEIPFELERGPRLLYEEIQAERRVSAELRREMELPGTKVFTIEDKAILQNKYERLRPAFDAIIGTLERGADAGTIELVLKNLDVLMDSAMWIGAYVFITDGAQEYFELYSKRKQAELARDEALKGFSDLVKIVDAVTDGRQISYSVKFALRIQPEVAERLGVPESEAPSPSAIRRALREAKLRKEVRLKGEPNRPSRPR